MPDLGTFGKEKALVMWVSWAPYHVQDATKIYLVSLPEVKCEYEDDPKCPDHHDHCRVTLRVPVCILVSHFSNDNSHWKAELL